jgi:uncharacterized protein
MLGELSPDEIESILHSQVVGRIGCFDSRNIFVVPIAYAYDGACIYGHSKEGMKIKMMRSNPVVCFEVDKVTNVTNWESVILWGTYEELTEPNQREAGLKVFSERMKPFTTDEVNMPTIRQPEPHPAGAVYKPIAFRIKVSRKTGRFERGYRF